MQNWRNFLSGSGDLDLSKIFHLPNLTESQRRHLVHVYNYLLGGIVLTAGGAAGGIFLAQTGVLSATALTNIGAVGSILSIIALAIDNATNIEGYSKAASTRQTVAFGGLSLSNGLVLTGALLWAMFLNVQILVTAFMATVAIFASLSLSAFYARSRAYFWLGSIAATLTSYMLMASFIQMFLRSAFLHSIFTYLGIGTTLLYILFDTQFILESAAMGNRNVISHALQIYIDFVTLFIRLLAMLTEQEGRKYEKKRR